MNRFYVPSATRYTPQFVEEQYPYGEMLALEEKKAQRSENVVEETGNLGSLLGPLTTPGHFTQDIAPKVRTELENKINEFTDKHADDYTSINTIRDLSRLRGEILNDPRVQAMQLDRDVWS